MNTQKKKWVQLSIMSFLTLFLLTFIDDIPMSSLMPAYLDYEGSYRLKGRADSGGTWELPLGAPEAPVVPGSPVSSVFDEDIIVYTAHQGWLSRIYFMRMDGSVISYFHYDFYFMADLEVVNNEVYIAEAFAPRVLKLDLVSGELDVIVDDWSLYYFYDVAFDGTFFYVTEWSLNRYFFNGSKDGAVGFGDVWGGASDGSYYWTLNDEDQIRCWDTSNWPSVPEISENSFSPPSSACRGLWFDGEYFWTAESIDGALGYIYKFDYDGNVISQWLEPAFQGWSACVVRTNDPPAIPEVPSGPASGGQDQSYFYYTLTTDPQDDPVSYRWDWGDGTESDWLGPYDSGQTAGETHVWSRGGSYAVRVKARDSLGQESEWSHSLTVSIFGPPMKLDTNL